ncbi:hypothetical protein ACOJVU_01330 [Mycobacterium sp. THU-M104]|uniref:hypothetical protein n=1 Tax=Mycobacterium sp. THU-M104 TaxID=3410515 RepID=UPI003B9C1D15
MVATLDSSDMPSPLWQILEQLLAEFTTIGFLCDDNPGRRKRPVVSVAAPVFDHRGRVALMLAVHPPCPLSAAGPEDQGKAHRRVDGAEPIPSRSGRGGERLSAPSCVVC